MKKIIILLAFLASCANPATPELNITGIWNIRYLNETQYFPILVIQDTKGLKFGEQQYSCPFTADYTCIVREASQIISIHLKVVGDSMTGCEGIWSGEKMIELHNIEGHKL